MNLPRGATSIAIAVTRRVLRCKVPGKPSVYHFGVPGGRLLRQVDRWPRWATDQAPIRAQCRGILTMKFWLLRPKGFSYHYTDTESCWGCVVRAADRETALALAATSELRLGDDFPDGWDVMEVPVDGPPAVIMFDY
jgi:hypothetical protein